MAESGDYTPAPHWSGYDFASARRAYKDNVIARGSVDPASIGLVASELAPESLTSESESPFVLICDVTGSMGTWPGVIFSKLPYLEHEGKEYLGEDMEICFAAVGDAHGDSYPLQVRPFVKGADLKTQLEKLIIEGKGGGTSQESYDLAALYFAKNMKFPNAIRKPIVVFIGDEGIYSVTEAEYAERYAKVKGGERFDPRTVFEELKKKCAVYVVRKPYNCDSNSPSEAEKSIQKQWCEFLGDDHVVSLPEADRVVDVLFGILAKETGRIDYFRKELEDRQGKDKGGDKKIEVVLKSLRSVHEPAKSLKKLPPPDRAKSITKKTGAGGAKSISLLDD